MLRLATVLPILILIAASPAAAQIDIEMAFTPAEVAPGEVATFTGSLDSSYEEAITAGFEFYMSFNDCEIGPFSLDLLVCPGQNTYIEFPMPVPASMPAGDLLVRVTVDANGMSDTATATLTVSGEAQSDPTMTLRDFLTEIVFNMTCDEVPISVNSVGTLKAVW